MSASGGAGDGHIRPSMQSESPGPLGTHDSASPDNQRTSTSTPGPLGTNDRTESGGMSEETRVLVARLNDGWDVLEASRYEIFHIVELNLLSPSSDNEDRLAEAWKAHGKLALAYFALMKEYLRDHYDPDANWGAILRVGWLMNDEVLRQLTGSEELYDVETTDMTAKLIMLHCEKAFEQYRRANDEESLFYFLALVAAVQAHGGEYYDELPFVIQSRLQRMAEETKPGAVEAVWQLWLRSMIKGYGPAAAPWLRELAKAVKKLESPSDPIKEHFQRTQMMERMGKE